MENIIYFIGVVIFIWFIINLLTTVRKYNMKVANIKADFEVSHAEIEREQRKMKQLLDDMSKEVDKAVSNYVSIESYANDLMRSSDIVLQSYDSLKEKIVALSKLSADDFLSDVERADATKTFVNAVKNDIDLIDSQIEIIKEDREIGYGYSR